MMLLISGVLATLLVSQTPTDEEVRRIVEKSMAAVELAEAKATRDIAEMRIRLTGCDSEIAKLQGENRTLAEAMSAEKQRLTGEVARLEAELQGTKVMLADEAETQRLSGDVALLEAELQRAKTMLEEMAGVASEARLGRDALSDSVQAIAAQMQRLTLEKAEALERIEAYQSRAALLEESLKTEMARPAEAGLQEVELRREIAELKERVAAHQNRVTVIEGSVRVELEKVAAREEQMIAERTSILSDSIAERSAALRESELERDKALAERDRLLAEQNKVLADLAETNRSLGERSVELQLIRAERDNVIEQLKTVTVQRDAAQNVVPRDASEVAALQKEISALRELLATPPPVAAAVVTQPIVQPVPVSEPLRGRIRAFDFNKATVEELAAIPAIGPTRARAIIWYRENVAPINSEEDLKSVPGFNDERINALKEYLTEVSR